MALSFAARASALLRRASSSSARAPRLAVASGLRSFSKKSKKAVGGDYGVYTGGKKVPFVTDMSFIQPTDLPTYSAYRIMDDHGNIVDGATDPELGEEECVKIYQTMIRLNNMDKVFYEAQRHGRISFYMQNHGEEACTIGSAAGLEPEDMIYGQYREAGALMYRGFTLQQFADQCFSNIGDPARGRQMPVHYGSAELNFQARGFGEHCRTDCWLARLRRYALKQASEPGQLPPSMFALEPAGACSHVPFVGCCCVAPVDHFKPAHNSAAASSRCCLRIQAGQRGPHCVRVLWRRSSQ